MGRSIRNRAETIALKSAGLGVLLGSGLQGVCEGFPTEATVPFDAVAGLTRPDVPGQKGEFRSCTVSGRPCIFVCGRKHFYEGSVGEIRTLVEFLQAVGLRRLVLTCAAGSLVKSVFPGELVLVSDVIDIQFRCSRRQGVGTPRDGVVTSPGSSARAGDEAPKAPPGEPGRPVSEALGRRADVVSEHRPADARRLTLDPMISKDLWVAASRAKVGLGRGAAIVGAGPAYETPAEIRALQETGASVVTMSGAPEIEIAGALGIRVAMLALVTNWAAGISAVELRHEDVLGVARTATARLRQLVVKLVEMS